LNLRPLDPQDVGSGVHARQARYARRSDVCANVAGVCQGIARGPQMVPGADVNLTLRNVPCDVDLAYAIVSCEMRAELTRSISAWNVRANSRRERLVLETADGKAIGACPITSSAPDGFDWGTYTTGARELARCTLAAALGAGARCIACAGSARVTAAGVAADANGRDEGATSRCPRCTDGIFVGFEGRLVAQKRRVETDSGVQRRMVAA
jgi:hypothetical protein